MDCIAEKILVLVIAYNCENQLPRKHKVFLAMIVSGELAGPKYTANYSCTKGYPVNILELDK